MDFPVYRKKIDNKSFYKITSPTTFDEVLYIGKQFAFYQIVADKYFEKLQIQAMIEADNQMYVACTEAEYQFQLKKKDSAIL